MNRVARLGLNRSTTALLAAIVLIGMGQELWAPFMPRFIEQAITQWQGGPTVTIAGYVLPAHVVVILAVGLFGSWRDLQEAIYYHLGGRLGGRLGTRRALLIFTAMPLIGYAMLLVWTSTITAFIALPFILAYDSIAQPATLTVVGKTLGERYRTLAISLQSIQRRIPRIIAYIAGGALVTALGAIGGVQAALAISALLIVAALIIQYRMLDDRTRDVARQNPNARPSSLDLFRQFPPSLRRLLAADIFARIAEGMPRELYILYAVSALTDAHAGHGFGAFGISPLAFGQLLALQAFVSLALYVPIGWLAAKRGGGSRTQPFIGLTFLFFALFPVAFWWLGHTFGLVGLIMAYVIAGLREIGEPARKAMITELVPPESPTAATGLYWSIRSLAVMPMPLIGAAVWLALGPAAVFIIASSLGLVGALFFLVLAPQNQDSLITLSPLEDSRS